MKPGIVASLTLLFVVGAAGAAAPKSDATGMMKAATPVADTGKPVAAAPADSIPSTEAELAADSVTAPAFGRCSVLTVPSEALIYLDDSLRGKSPLFIDSVSPGRHDLQIKRKGYFVKKAALTFAAGASQTVSFELTKPARMAVATDPPGAVVHFTAADSCLSPCADEKLRPGTYVLDIGKPGFALEKDSVTLAAGANDSVHLRLKPEAGKPATTAAAAATGGRESKTLTRALISLTVFVVFAVVVLIAETNH
jgi:hypothetical protein